MHPSTGGTPSRRRVGHWTQAALIVGLCLASGPAQAQWDLRVVGNYQAYRLGRTHYENSYQELLARRAWQVNEVTSFNLTARLRRDENHLEGDHNFTGQIDGDYRSPSLNLFLRHRPNQRPDLQQPAEWRRRQTVWGGSWHSDGLPQFNYEESRRNRTEGDTLAKKSHTLDRRFVTTWQLLGVNLDFTHRRTENQAASAGSLARTPKLANTEDSGGAEASRLLFSKLLVGAGYRASAAEWERSSGVPRRSRYQRAESDLNLQLARWFQWNAAGSWQRTERREDSQPWNRDRLLEVSSSLTLRPTNYLSTTMVRTYQEQRTGGVDTGRLDYARVQIEASGRVLPELTVNGGVSRNWTLSQRGLSRPSNQANLGLRGQVRRGVDLNYTVTGQALEDVPDSIRYQLGQGVDLRLQPSMNTRFSMGVQTQRLGHQVTLRQHDQAYYRVDGYLSGARGSSLSLTYSSQVLRRFSAREKYSIAGQVAVPFKAVLLSNTGTVSRATGNDARLGRPWGVSSTSSARMRVHRRSDLTVSFTRNLPAVGDGSSMWQALLTQRFR